jgi:hypothetical protein
MRENEGCDGEATARQRRPDGDVMRYCPCNVVTLGDAVVMLW